MMISQPNFQNVISSVKIMTRISYFFKELSEDNDYVADLLTPDTQSFIFKMGDVLSVENCDFVANITLFYLNMVVAKTGIASL